MSILLPQAVPRRNLETGRCAPQAINVKMDAAVHNTPMVLRNAHLSMVDTDPTSVSHLDLARATSVLVAWITRMP